MVYLKILRSRDITHPCPHGSAGFRRQPLGILAKNRVNHRVTRSDLGAPDRKSLVEKDEWARLGPNLRAASQDISEEIKHMTAMQVQGATVTTTGGTGSVGSKMVSHILSTAHRHKSWAGLR